MSKRTAERFQDPLEDRGWQQMKQLLDREMPEKKRRAMWWPWFGVTAVFLIFLITYAVSHTFKTDSQEKDQVQSEGTQLSETPVLPGEVANKTKTEADRSLNENLNPSSLKDTRSETPGSKEKGNTELSVFIAESKRLEPPATDDFEATRKIPAIIENEITSGENQMDTDPASGFDQSGRDAVVVQNEKKESLQNTYDLAFLDKTAFVLDYRYALGIPEQVLAQESGDQIQAGKKAKVDLELSTAVLTESSFKKPSFDIGLDLSYRPFRNVAVGAGFYYWTIRSDQTFTATNNSSGFLGAAQNDFGDALVAIPEMQDKDTMDRQQPGNITYYQTIRNISYLRIPLFIRLFPESPWQPYAGIDQLFLLSDGRNGLLENQRSLDAVTNGATIVSFSELVRRSNTAFLFGLRYQPGNHWSVDLSYHHAGKSYLNYSVSQGAFYEYHRFFRLALGYRF